MRKILMALLAVVMLGAVRVYGEDIRASNPVIEDGKITINYDILLLTHKSICQRPPIGYFPPPTDPPENIIWGRMVIQLNDGLYHGTDNECATITIGGAVEEPCFQGAAGTNRWRMKLIVKSPDGFSAKTRKTDWINGASPNRTMTSGDRTFETGLAKETYKMKDLLDSDAEGIGTVELYYVSERNQFDQKIQDFRFQYKNGKVRFSKTLGVPQEQPTFSPRPPQTSSEGYGPEEQKVDDLLDIERGYRKAQPTPKEPEIPVCGQEKYQVPNCYLEIANETAEHWDVLVKGEKIGVLNPHSTMRYSLSSCAAVSAEPQKMTL